MDTLLYQVKIWTGQHQNTWELECYIFHPLHKYICMCITEMGQYIDILPYHDILRQ